MTSMFCASDTIEDVLLINDCVSKLRTREFSRAPYTGTEHPGRYFFTTVVFRAYYLHGASFEHAEYRSQAHR